MSLFMAVLTTLQEKVRIAWCFVNMMMNGNSMNGNVVSSDSRCCLTGIANPVACILSAAMLLRYTLKLESDAIAVEEACSQAMKEGFRTPDIKGELLKSCTTQEITDAIIHILESKLCACK